MTITETHAERTAEALKAAPTGKKRILVVDDCADLLSLNRSILEAEAFEVFTAQSGAEALLLLSEIAQPDLILLDMRMKDMSGVEFLALLEEGRPEIFEHVPVVFLTAADKVPVGKAMGHIRKPFDIERFLSAVHRFIESGTGRPRHEH